MKILTLNASQQKKLLKLCQEYFPEYSYVVVDDYNGDGVFLVGFGHEDNDNIKYIIHWYELCCTELCKRIFMKISFKNEPEIFQTRYESLLEMRSAVLRFHPVGFLWNYVAHCKKNKWL